MKLGDLFILQLLYENYEEFTIDNFDIAFNKYFNLAKNKELIREILIKYLFDVKFTKEELKRVIQIRESRADEDELISNAMEWEEYNSKKIFTK